MLTKGYTEYTVVQRYTPRLMIQFEHPSNSSESGAKGTCAQRSKGARPSRVPWVLHCITEGLILLDGQRMFMWIM